MFGCHETFGYESTIKNGFPKRARMNKNVETKINKNAKKGGGGDFFCYCLVFVGKEMGID